MHIRLAYDIQFDLPADAAMVVLLNVHPSRAADLLEPDEIETEPRLDVTSYLDTFGNRCARFVAPRGHLRLAGSTLIRDSGDPDPVNPGARETPVAELPNDLLRFLLSSRYCEVDLFSSIAFQLFGQVRPGWGRVQAICDWVNNHITFDYQQARPTKSAMNVYNEQVGVCRDFQHLAITFCRAMNIPARYASGYLGDIGVPLVLPMDFSAWFEAWLDGRWWAFDARNNVPRIGRVLMATGRDAADVALTTSFGQADLRHFFVVAEEEIPEPLEVQTVDPLSGLPYFVSPPGA
ncbi:MAG TPA: transglutaminase family protein [Terracidiphilus sp.]|jgi:transglutaminase-like putative cysteine protease